MRQDRVTHFALSLPWARQTRERNPLTPRHLRGAGQPLPTSKPPSRRSSHAGLFSPCKRTRLGPASKSRCLLGLKNPRWLVHSGPDDTFSENRSLALTPSPELVSSPHSARAGAIRACLHGCGRLRRRPARSGPRLHPPRGHVGGAQQALRMVSLVSDPHSRRAPRVHTPGFPRVAVPGSPPLPPACFAAASPAFAARRASGERDSLGAAAGAWDRMGSPKRPLLAG